MKKSLQLDQVQAGEIVRLLGFIRCRRWGLRLTELGLTPGTTVEVLRASRGQPMLLRVRGAQLAIDRNTARKIEVASVSDERERHARGWRSRRRAGGWRGFGRGGHGRNRPHGRNVHGQGRESEGDSSER